MQFMCMFAALGWAVFVAPIAHAKAEGLFAFQHDSSEMGSKAWGQKKRDKAAERESIASSTAAKAEKEARAASMTPSEAAALLQRPAPAELKPGRFAAALFAAQEEEEEQK